MIDIDLLDEQLEAALSVELRSRLTSAAKPWEARSRRPALAPARTPEPEPWSSESDVWVVDDEVWGVDPDPWPSDPDIWAGGADAWPPEPQPEVKPPAPVATAQAPTVGPAAPAAPMSNRRPAPAPAARRATPINPKRQESVAVAPSRRLSEATRGPRPRPDAEPPRAGTRGPDRPPTSERPSPAAPRSGRAGQPNRQPPAGGTKRQPSSTPAPPPTARADRQPPARRSASSDGDAATAAASRRSPGPKPKSSTPTRSAGPVNRDAATPAPNRRGPAGSRRNNPTPPPAPSGWTAPSLMALPFEKATPAPEAPRPTTAKPGASKQVTPKPATVRPTTGTPVPDKPVIPGPAGMRPLTTKPAAATPTTAPAEAPKGDPRPHRPRGLQLRPHHVDAGLLDAVPALDIEGHAQKVVEFVAAGRIDQADLHIAAHAHLATEEGTMADRRDAAAWAAMRAILDGRQADARAGNELVRQLGAQASDPNADERYWQQRFWVILEWGNEEERFELLDHCRRRAYWQQDIYWRSALVLLLARLGRPDEAAREFDETAPRVLNGRAHDAEWLDMTTNLAEAASLMNDPRRATTVNRAVDWPNTGMVVVGQAHVCKGSIARFHALLATTTIRWAEADHAFGTATDAHRRAAAHPLLARTLREWGRSLTGRDDLRSRNCLQESTALATELQLVELLASE